MTSSASCASSPSSRRHTRPARSATTRWPRASTCCWSAWRRAGSYASGGHNMAETKVKAADVVKHARRQLAELTGRQPEAVLGVGRNGNGDDGWKVTMEMLEMRRVPNSTDLLGCYEVTLDGDGDLLEYRRTRRYARGQADDGEARCPPDPSSGPRPTGTSTAPARGPRISPTSSRGCSTRASSSP